MTRIHFQGGRLDGRWYEFQGTPPSVYEAYPLQVVGVVDGHALVRPSGRREIYDLYLTPGSFGLYILRPEDPEGG